MRSTKRSLSLLVGLHLLTLASACSPPADGGEGAAPGFTPSDRADTELGLERCQLLDDEWLCEASEMECDDTRRADSSCGALTRVEEEGPPTEACEPDPDAPPNVCEATDPTDLVTPVGWGWACCSYRGWATETFYRAWARLRPVASVAAYNSCRRFEDRYVLGRCTFAGCWSC